MEGTDNNVTQNEETNSFFKFEPDSVSVKTITETSQTYLDSKMKFINEITRELIENAINKAGVEGGSDDNTQSSQNTAAFVAEILEALVHGAEYNIQLKETYKQKCLAHNQYGLFNLMDHIPNFSIDDEFYEAITFRECLIINRLDILIDKHGETVYFTIPVGGICIDVQQAGGQQPQERLLEEYEEKLIEVLDEEGICNHKSSSTNLLLPPQNSEDSLEQQREYGFSKFVVHVSSHLDVEGSNGGSSITTWVDRNCHTIEELRKEFIVDETNEINVREKTLYTAMKHHYYYIKHTDSRDNIIDKKLYHMTKMTDYVSESASFILMRYLAIKRHFGQFELSCCYINGDMCRNIYECFGPESETFNGTKVDCCRIRRTILEECGLEHTSITVLALNGMILKHEWSGCDYVLTANPKLRIQDTKPTCLDEMTMNDCWTEDLQMLSEYLDMKDRTLLETKSYDLDHPELRQLMADYVNQILMLRPSDIKDFTFQYFGSFVSSSLPRNDYFE